MVGVKSKKGVRELKKILGIFLALALAVSLTLVPAVVSANPGDGDVTVVVRDQASQPLENATAVLGFYGSPGGMNYLTKSTDATGTAAFTQAEIETFLTDKFDSNQQVYLQPGAVYEGSSIGSVRTVGPNPLVPEWGNDAPSILYNTPGDTWTYKPAMAFSYKMVMFDLVPPIATWTGTDVTVKFSLAEPLTISPTSQVMDFYRTVHDGESPDYYLGSPPTTWKYPASSTATITDYDISGTTTIASLGCIAGDETMATVTLGVSPAQSFSTPPSGVNDQYGNARGSYVDYYKFWNTTLVAEPPSLPPDGSSTSTITATINDATGAAVVDGKSIILYTSLGSITSPITTSGGKAIATLTAASSSGTADVRAAGGQLDVEMKASVTLVSEVQAHIISISVSPTYIDFGDLYAGDSSAAKTLTITNNGTVAVKVTGDTANESETDFYLNNLTLDGTYKLKASPTWEIPSLAKTTSQGVEAVLSIPPLASVGPKTATLVFWAEEAP